MCFLATFTRIRQRPADKQTDLWNNDAVSGWKTQSNDQTYGMGLSKHYRWGQQAQMAHLLADRQRLTVKYRVFEYYAETSRCRGKKKTELISAHKLIL